MAELSLIVKATVVLAIGLAAARGASRASAAVRALIVTTTFGVLLLLPAAPLVVPPNAVTIPVTTVSTSMFTFADEPGAATGSLDLPMQTTAGGPARSWPLPSVTTLLRLLWLTGTLLVLLPLVAVHWRVRRLSVRASRWPDGDRLAADIAPRMTRRGIAVLISNEIQVPMTFGVRRPRIVFPMDTPAWPAADLRQALLHEMEHVRRRDWLVQMMVRVTCAFYWFHPLAWAAWRRLQLECEQACDDAVLREAEQTVYAEQLVMLARRLANASAVPLLSMADGSHLSQRVSAVLDGGRARGRVGLLAATSIAGVSLAMTVLIAPLHAVDAGTPAPTQSTPEVLSIPTATEAALDVLVVDAAERPSSNDAPVVSPQAPAPAAAGAPSAVAFEVASIKRNRSTDPARGRVEPGGRFTAINAPVLTIVRQAYGVFPYQVLDAPDWVRFDGYDIIARLPDGMELAPQTLSASLRTLLASRFGFAAHQETREMATYELVFARQDRRLGPKLQQSTVDCTIGMTGQPAPASPAGEMPCALLGSFGRYQVRGFPLDRFAQSIAGAVGRPVVDKTGLAGTWNLELEFTPENEPGSGPGDPPGIFTALEEQLGLKLEPSRGAVDVLIIDRVERPSED